MGGAQPLAATLNGAAFLGIDVDPERIKRRVKTGYCDVMVNDLDEALRILKNAVRKREATSVGLVGNCADVIPELARRGVVPDLLTDQTSAHDPIGGYIPQGLDVAQAAELRQRDPETYRKRSLESMAQARGGHARAAKAGRGHVRLRQQHSDVCLTSKALRTLTTFPDSCRHIFGRYSAKGAGRFAGRRFRASLRISIARISWCWKCFRTMKFSRAGSSWRRNACNFRDCPARICWLGYGERDKFGLALNDLVARGELKAPIVIGRDHLDCGSVASPFRETEKMLDGSDAVADWPLLNALLNTASGASWVSIHNGGGVGIGYSQHAGQVTVADGTKEMASRIERVLTNDPGIGVARHVDAGYPEAIEFARKSGVKIPMG